MNRMPRNRSLARACASRTSAKPGSRGSALPTIAARPGKPLEPNGKPSSQAVSSDWSGRCQPHCTWTAASTGTPTDSTVPATSAA